MLTTEERETLERWARRPTTAQARALRLPLVLRCAVRETATAIARDVHVTKQTVGKWSGRFLADRLDGLLDEARPGVPRTITDAHVERVSTTRLEATPRDATPGPPIEENRVLRRQLGGRRLRLTEDDRRRLAARAYRLGRHALRAVATIVTPDTLLRWRRQLIARKWTYAKKRTGRRAVLADIRHLVGRMAMENPTYGYTRIQGALKNLGHHVSRSTIARILRAQRIPPLPDIVADVPPGELG